MGKSTVTGDGDTADSNNNREVRYLRVGWSCPIKETHVLQHACVSYLIFSSFEKLLPSPFYRKTKEETLQWGGAEITSRLHPFSEAAHPRPALHGSWKRNSRA